MAELITAEEGRAEGIKVLQRCYDKLLTPNEAMSELEKIADRIE